MTKQSKKHIKQIFILVVFMQGQVLGCQHGYRERGQAEGGRCRNDGTGGIQIKRDQKICIFKGIGNSTF